jgi:hypothetical protein
MAVTTRQITSNILGLIGAVAGGVLGYYTFQWIYHHGFYGMMIPGALLGLGCGLLAQHPSQVRGVICGLAALGLGLFTEWSFFPFRDDNSPVYFLKNITALSPVTLGMIAAGAFFAYWLGKDGGFLKLPGSQRQAAIARKLDSPPSK